MDPDDPAAVVRLVLEQQEARARCRRSRQRSRRKSSGRSPSARRRRARARGRRATRSTPRRRTARSCASIPRPAPTPGASRRRSGFRRAPAPDASIVAVGTDKGDVLAFTADGKPLWQAKVTSEVVSPPKVADGVVVVWSGDGRVFGLSAADGKTRWVYQRNNPPLTVRNFAGGVITRGGLFMGTAGGKLLALDLAHRQPGLGSATSRRRRARPSSSASPTSRRCRSSTTARPARSPTRAASRASTSLRGTLNWSRDVSSLEGIAADARYVYVTDDKGAVHALDKTTGASAWKQDKLAAAQARRSADRRRLRRRRRWRRLRAPARHQRRQPRRARRDRRHGAPRAQPEPREPVGAPAARLASVRRRSACPSDRSVLDARVRTDSPACCPPSSSSGVRTSASRRCSIA